MNKLNNFYFVYIIQSQKDFSFYIGYSKDPDTRLFKHNNSNSGYTSNKKPWKLVYQEKFESKRDAIIRERFLKNQRNSIFYKKLLYNFTS